MAKAIGASRVPEFATNATGQSHPHIEETPPYVLVFHPRRWMVLAGKLVPSLSRQPLADGVNQISIDRKGAVRLASYRARLETEGRSIIPYNWAPDGESYLDSVDTRPGGRADVKEAWISVWEEAPVGASQTVSDETGYAEWLEGLVKSGKLTPCPIDVIERMLEEARLRQGRAAIVAAKNQGAGRSAEREAQLKAEVEVLEAALKACKAERENAKKKKGVRTPVGADNG
jgi:hypothetical protein